MVTVGWRSLDYSGRKLAKGVLSYPCSHQEYSAHASEAVSPRNFMRSSGVRQAVVFSLKNSAMDSHVNRLHTLAVPSRDAVTIFAPSELKFA